MKTAIINITPAAAEFLRKEIEQQVWAAQAAPTYEPRFPTDAELATAVKAAQAGDGVVRLDITVGCGDDPNGVVTYTVIKEVAVPLPKIFFGFALADGMFAGAGECTIRRTPLTPDLVREAAEAGVFTPCLNPSHAATIAAMRERFGIDVPIPPTPPKVDLHIGDAVVVMGVRGLPRLTDRHEYTEEEVASATFSFSVYEVVPE